MPALPQADLHATMKVGLPREVLFVNVSSIATVSIYERYGPKPRIPTLVSLRASDLVVHVWRNWGITARRREVEVL